MSIKTNHDHITKAIIRSQHCQRNWDLSKQIPAEDLQVLVTAATQCPSKQNIAYYRTHFITKRAVIEAIHGMTKGFTIGKGPDDTTTNSQTLANLLLVFEAHDGIQELTEPRNDETQLLMSGCELSAKQREALERDREMAIGIAAGYINLTASLLGYSTGCCACFDSDGIRDLLGLQRGVVLLMGIGFRDPTRNRRLHHLDDSFVFPTKIKQPIPVNFVQ